MRATDEHAQTLLVPNLPATLNPRRISQHLDRFAGLSAAAGKEATIWADIDMLDAQNRWD